jgi:ketosteroid isomerase-like protein
VEVERFKGTIGGNPAGGSLRVTTVFRPEHDGWRVTFQYADPKTTPRGVESILEA